MHAARAPRARLVSPMATRNPVERQIAGVEAFLDFWSLKRALILGAILFAGWWTGTSIRATRWFVGMLPAALHTTGLATVGNDATLAHHLGLALYKPCGGATFSLTRGTLAAIERDGLAFFDTARQPRRLDYPRPLDEYAPWRETPVPEQWTDNGMWLGLYCMGWASSRHDIYLTARVRGSYYTTMRNMQLLVIPKLGLAVLTFRGY